MLRQPSNLPNVEKLKSLKGDGYKYKYCTSGYQNNIDINKLFCSFIFLFPSECVSDPFIFFTVT